MDEHELIAEIQQVRSEFQLRHFVIGQHDTPEMQFFQCCIELQDMEHKLAHATLTRRETEIKIARQRSKNTPLGDVKAEKLELGLRQQALAEIGARREVEILRRILGEMEHFTRAEIEQAQPEYWRLRLQRQADLQIMQAQTGVGWAQLDAMHQAGMLTALPSGDDPEALTA